MVELADPGGADDDGNETNPDNDDPLLQANLPRGDDQRAQAEAQEAQLGELEAKVEEDRRAALGFRVAFEDGHERRGDRAREAGRLARARIDNNDDVNDPLMPTRTSQKLIAAAALLRAMPEPATPEGRNLCREARTLIEQAAVQQAESSASHRRHSSFVRGGGSAREEGATSAHAPQRDDGSQTHPRSKQRLANDQQPGGGQRTPVPRTRQKGAPAKTRLRDTRNVENHGNGRGAQNQKDRGIVSRCYQARRGGRFDPEHDRSLSPEPAGTCVFSREIRTAPIPPRFRQPATLTKYSGETDPQVWLDDYRLACQLGGATNDAMIIRNLPLHLADSARTWLEHLPANQIHDWGDLVETFVGNFQGTKWDLRGCRQKKDESLRDFIRRFSKRCTELPQVSDSDVIGAFLEATTCGNLVHKLGRKRPSTVSQLLDIATKYASGDEAVAATSCDKRGKRAEPSPAEDGDSGNPSKKAKKLKKGKKLQKPREPRRNLLKNDDSDEAFAAEPNRKGSRGPPPSGGVFDDMLKKPCPYHRTVVTHTLEQCEMLRKYYNRVRSRDGGSKEDDSDKKVEGYPHVEHVFFVLGGPSVNMTPRQRRRERREVFSIQKATPAYLDWSEEAISFSRDDHPDYIPNPGQYPLVVDPIIGNTRFSKVLMDGGSSINIMYAPTLELMGISAKDLAPSKSSFHGVAPGKRVLPLGKIDLPVCFGTPANFRKETLTFEVVGFKGSYHAILGRPCYAKFMAIPNYTYLKLKMPGPKGVITVGPTFEHAYECDVEGVEYAEALAQDEALAADLEKMANEAADAKFRHAGTFEPAEGTKEVPFDPSVNDGKALRVSSTLDSK